ncbi:nitrilase-related carbon-nitrogen hydrolase [Kyrpidia tusciae]|uniref:Nitrilase/cyanide hydratase and apolipoprotein N-acyltransferase n=1 Tax=Kyrpidia tusciae (strain DSM 2912 / NBRC 15312 / T2) TaxID=562970 RepID=D5WW83_KYRT2|nr:nitrilase-related carbon-nitrogen hydrolase [Kyrpidia tusciae]ADG05715.1 Nitrilase/cyanide hydratase and apolipoprotein N- acyltransferase [Kyrpidia tusciae DSM 2912]
MPFRVGLVQMRPVLGDVAENARRHVMWVEKAKGAGCDLVVFPELSLTGYWLKDLAVDCARMVEDREVRQVIQASRHADIVFGMVEMTKRYTLYNTALYVSGGEVVYRHHKVYPPTYGMFEENRYFGRGKRVRAFDAPGGRFGLMICEDAWHPSVPYILTEDGAMVLIIPSASPARPAVGERVGSQETWYRTLRTYAQLFGVYVLFANRVGVEDGVAFYGGSAVVDPFGEIIAAAPEFEETLLVVDVHEEVLQRSRLTTPLGRDEQLDVTVRELGRIYEGRYGGGRWSEPF